MASNPLLLLPVAALGRLRVALSDGGSSYCINGTTLKKALPDLPAACVAHLINLASAGWSAGQLSELVEAIREARETRIRDTHLLDLVISGPEHPLIPTRDTSAVYRELVRGARREVILASFAIYNGKEIFAPLVDRMRECPDLKAILYLDIPRIRNDTTLPDQLIATYRQDFVTKQWPSGPLPRLLYHKPSLDADWKLRASMHAKVVIADRERAFVSSANLTKAAQSKNIEVGTLIESTGLASRLADYFEGLEKLGRFAAF